MDEVEVVLAEDVAVVEEAKVLLVDHPLDRRRHPTNVAHDQEASFGSLHTGLG